MVIPRPTVREHLGLLPRTRDIAGLLNHLYERWGPIVDVGYRYPLDMVYLFGPEANQLILHDRPENFLWGDALSTLIPVNGPTALVVTDGDEHARRRRLVQPAFAKRRVDAHLELIVEEADRMLESWIPGRSVDAWAEGRTAIRRIVVRALFGHRLGRQADQIGELLEPALKYVNSNPATRVDVDLRFNGYGKAARARRAVDGFVQQEIDRRRSAIGDDGDADILSALLAASDDGDSLSDAEIRDQVRSLIAAGYDTTTSALSWLIYGLGANPSKMTSMAEQVRDLLGDRPPTIGDLRTLSAVDGVVRETLRLWPPGTVSLRTAIEPFECYGHEIDAGRLVVYSPYITHRMETIWDDPSSFRPERWLEGEPAPYSYVPFGGGGRNCIGFALATLELQVFAVRLVQHCRWTVDRDEPRSKAVASFAPTGGLPITIE
ncbi:MAG: cytochrome P450 [Acidimicrobiia bacterium]|nr:cytochrome P450 [Acidimicrobiia bacterium]